MSDSTAIIQLAGKQYLVKTGDVLEVNLLSAQPAEKLTITDVLLVTSASDTKVGTPLVEKATVTLEVVEHFQGDKLRVATYKAKSRTRRVKGHRQQLTKVKVVAISA